MLSMARRTSGTYNQHNPHCQGREAGDKIGKQQIVHIENNLEF